jgi:hypothetical protein
MTKENETKRKEEKIKETEWTENKQKETKERKRKETEKKGKERKQKRKEKKEKEKRKERKQTKNEKRRRETMKWLPGNCRFCGSRIGTSQKRNKKDFKSSIVQLRLDQSKKNWFIWRRCSLLVEISLPNSLKLKVFSGKIEKIFGKWNGKSTLL